MISILSSSPIRWTLPLGVFTALYGTFAIGDSILSRDLKENLSSFLMSDSSFEIMERFPSISNNFFESFFGERHLSFKCLKASVLVSLFSIFSLFLFTFLYNPHLLVHFVESFSKFYEKSVSALRANAKTQILAERLSGMGFAGTSCIVFMFWVFWSFIPDYLSLLKSRIIIILFTSKPPSIVGFIVTLLFDFAISIAIFFANVAAFQAVVILVLASPHLLFANSIESALFAISLIAPFIFAIEMAVFLNNGMLFISVPIANLFWASIVPSLWLWIYIISALAARLFIRSHRVLFTVRKYFDLQNSPVRFLGLLAASAGALFTVVFLIIGTIIQAVS